MRVRLTSHFAGNKVTLYDFQLAEQMNASYKISQKEFNMYPKISARTWATWKILLSAYLIGALTFQFFAYWGQDYPTAMQRGDKP